MGARAMVWAVLILGGWVFSAGAAEEMMIIKVYSGIEHKGVVEKVDETTITLRTAYGVKSIRRSDIITSRKELSADERAKIASDLAAAKPAPAEARGAGEIRAADASSAPHGGESVARGNSATTGERMVRGMNRRVTMEFVDTPLVDAVDFMQNLTGLSIIIDPKVRELKPTVSLRVTDMDAATALKWITQLTDTYAELSDQAIFITHKKSAAAENQERADIVNMAAAMQAEIELPPEGQPITDADRMKIALALWMKEQPQVHDYPGPEITIGAGAESPFQFVPAGK